MTLFCSFHLIPFYGFTLAPHPFYIPCSLSVCRFGFGFGPVFVPKRRDDRKMEDLFLLPFSFFFSFFLLEMGWDERWWRVRVGKERDRGGGGGVWGKGAEELAGLALLVGLGWA